MKQNMSADNKTYQNSSGLNYSGANHIFNNGNQPQIRQVVLPVSQLTSMSNQIEHLNKQCGKLLESHAKENEEIISLEYTIETLEKKLNHLTRENSMLKQKLKISENRETDVTYSHRTTDPQRGIISENQFSFHHKRKAEKDSAESNEIKQSRNAENSESSTRSRL